MEDSKMMVEGSELPSLGAQRHKCSACYKQYKKKEHLVIHMKRSFHSSHDPICNVCKKHCKTLESVREHLTGPLAKGHCAEIFSSKGCNLCLNIFENSDALSAHEKLCLMVPAPFLPETGIPIHIVPNEATRVFSLKCVMVGGGSDGSIDLCARVCLINESDHVIFHSYVKPPIPVSDYRIEWTGITEEKMEKGLPVAEVKRIIMKILYHQQPPFTTEQPSILVGHGLQNDLVCLNIKYPNKFIRDTSKYRPLLKTNMVCNSLKYLAQTYLGYEIQQSAHDPYEDCVAAMRLYKRLRSQFHQRETCQAQDGVNGKRDKELIYLSKPAYYCWCLDYIESRVSV